MSKSKVSRYINPVLTALEELGGSARPTEVCSYITEKLHLSEEELSQQKKAGGSVFENHVAWARFYLAKTGYIDSSKYGVWKLTEKGRAVQELSDIEITQIRRTVQEQTKAQKQQNENGETAKNIAESEEDLLEPETISNYKEELLTLLLTLSPAGFERLCQRLLRESGFQQVTVTGRSGDGGIDGIGVLQVNPFVSFKVLFQCKRYAGTVGTPVIRDFRGAMMGRTDKGIIITTGNFTADAKKEAVRDGVPPIELVNGEDLIEMFEKLELGLTPRITYDVDIHFFDEFLQ